MKRSETPDVIREQREDYIGKRWEQLATRGSDAMDHLVRYVFLVNAGSAAAALSFIGAMEDVRSLHWPRTALTLFAVGVVLVGVFYAYRYHRLEWLFLQWRSDSKEWREDKIEWNMLLDRDTERFRFKVISVLPYLIGYSSLGCFLSGLWITIANFSDITSIQSEGGANYERTQNAAPAIKSIPSGNTAAASARSDERPADAGTASSGNVGSQRSGAAARPSSSSTAAGQQPIEE